MKDRPVESRTNAAGIGLLTLASAQFLMTLDTSVMNVSIAQVAKDVGTSVTGIQTAITLYTLVMATLMITGGKIGSIIGRRRALAIGCVIYGGIGALVGGLQNTMTNLGASLGTALAGSILIASLTTAFISGIEENPAVPAEVSEHAAVQLVSGVPFVSDADLEKALDDAGLQGAEAQAIVDENEKARIQALRASLSVLALAALVALFFTRLIPVEPMGSPGTPEPAEDTASP